MGRRVCDPDIVEPPRKRNRTVSENVEPVSDLNIDKPLPPGEILTDVTQKQWRIGKPIGCGSFGEIYLASDDIAKEATSHNSRYVIKIEPHSNGPLFVEIHCLIRTARHSKIKKWQNEKKLNLLGMPHYIANGSHLIDETRYRFLVLPRYETDVEKTLRSFNSNTMQLRNVLVLSAQIIDVLEYLHSQGYVHSDIKSSNLMIGFDGSLFKNNKQRKIKQTPKKCDSKNTKQKIKYSSYYYDEDFVLHNYLSSNSNTDYETDDENNVAIRNSRNSKYINPSKNARSKLSLNNKKIRVKGFFNLRKLKSDVNYEDLNSSICSHDSYQDLIENNARNRINFSHSSERICESKCSENGDDNEINHFEEAICSQSPGQAYLLDYGLASKFVNSDGSHKEFVMDQRKAHDGTLEYSSRDSHIGAHSRRSDLENLGYNILDWLTGSLPWKTPKMLHDPDLVHALKNSCMKDIRQLMEACFKSQSYPKFIEKYFGYLKKLEFHEKPDYRYCKNLFINEFKDQGFGAIEDMVLNFTDNENITKKKIIYSKKVNLCKNTPPDFLKRNAIVKVFGRENLQGNSWENNLKMDLIRESLSNDGIRKPCVSRNFFVSDADLISKLRQTLLLTHDTPSKKFSPKNLRSTKCVVKKRKGGRNNKSNIGKFGNFLGSEKQYTWAEILAGNPESFMRKSEKDKNGQSNDANDKTSKNPRSRKVSNASEISLSNGDINSSPILLNREYLSSLNPTYAMKEVVENYHRKTLGREKQKNDEFECVSNEHGYTPAMVRVIKNIEKRKKKEKLLAAKEEKKIVLISAQNKKSTKQNIKAKSIGRRKSSQGNIEIIQPSAKDISPKKNILKPNKNLKVNNQSMKSVVKPNGPIRELRRRNTSPLKTTTTPDTANELNKTKSSTSKSINKKITKPTNAADPTKCCAAKSKKMLKSTEKLPSVKRIIATRSRGPIK